MCEVLPHFPWEHIGIVNQGPGEVNLKGWSISDGEGSLTFLRDVDLDPMEEAFIGPNITFLSLLHPDSPLLEPSSDLCKKGRMALADEGDETLLLNPQGMVVDLIAYGRSTFSGEGWRGEKCASPPEGKVLRRTSLAPHSDSDTSADWAIDSPGRSQLNPSKSEAMVEAFLCPDQMRSRIIRELRFAQRSVAVAVYLLSDYEVVGSLAAAARRGVHVRVLVEGQPVGGLTVTQTRILEALSSAGCEVFQSFAYHGFKRYDYLHCKYLVVDSRRVLLASENWARESLESNRGWGITVDSAVVAEAFLVTFDKDLDARFPDIWPITPKDVEGLPALLEPDYDCSAPAPSSIAAEVETILAPDFSYRVVLEMIASARQRLNLELFYFSDKWHPGQDPFQAILDAARRGVSVRLLLDGNWYNNQDGKGNRALAARLNEIASLEHLDMRAKTLSPYHDFTTLHNKGMIADDQVLICSINWVRASFEENREAGLRIISSEVAGFFARAFEGDWIDDSEAPNIIVAPSVQVHEGEELVLNATASDNSGSVRICWDVGDDGSIDAEGAFMVLRLPPGVHSVRVTALDPSNNSRSTEVEVVVLPGPGNDGLPLAAAGVIVGGLALWKLRKRVKWS